MEYLCYTLEESRYVRENATAQRMVIDTMKVRVGISILFRLFGLQSTFLHPKKAVLCGRSETSPRRSTLGYLLCVGGSIDSTKGCNTIELHDPLYPTTWENAGSIQHKRVQFGVAVIEDR